MTCLHCGSTHQRGRFCNRCGRKRPPTAPRGGATRPTGPDPATIRNLYDTALAREAVAQRPLDRYLSVLLANPGPA